MAPDVLPTDQLALLDALPFGVVVLAVPVDGTPGPAPGPVPHPVPDHEGAAWQIRHANPAAAVLLGAGDPGELSGRRFPELFPPGHRPGMIRGLAATAAGEPLREAVDLAGRVLEMDARPWSAGAVPCVLVHLTDISAAVEGERSLQMAQGRLRAFFDQNPVGMVEIDFGGRLLAANQALGTMLGLTVDEVLARTIPALTHPASTPSPVEVYGEIMRTGHWTGEQLARRTDGDPVPVLHALSLVRAPDGSPHHLAGIVVDITAWKAAEQALRASEEQLRLSFDGALIGVSLIDLAPRALGTVLRANTALCDFLGRRESELIGLTFDEVVHPEDATAWRSAATGLARGEFGSWRAEARFVHAGGGYRWGLISAAAVHDREGRPLHAVSQVEDITARKEAESRLVRQALHDGLTGLANRLYLQDHLRHALARADRTGTKVGVLFLDLDNFKAVNDVLGHAGGDELLREVGRRLTGALRAEDVAARLGGDEFVVVCADLATADEIRPLAQRLVDVLAEETWIAGRLVNTAASVGAAVSRPGADPDVLLRDADAAMYRAKGRGKGCWEIADEALHAAAARLLEVEAGLRSALVQDELELHYQPTVQLRTGRLVGVEALLRWRHPRRGLLLPADFLDVAEDRRLMVQIGDWVLRRACHQAADWQRRFGERAPVVAVNIASVQVGRQALAARTRDLLGATGLAAQRLCLEITERQVIDLAGSSARDLQDLAGLGVQLAVDDFGTGYSGFGYLRSLPVHVLKLDRSFVAGLGRDRTDTAITRSVVALGQTLGLTVVAEGVETEEQRELLLDLDCPQGQGWLWQSALPPDGIDRLLAAA
ncbi:MAG TPA: EAL domain-containing protein [Kineosporiaceae bacterium]|nr:EAL domain-containing protein [Kineosporiaceae bacterium]